MELAAAHVNSAGGIGHRPLCLLLRDTGGGAPAGLAAVEELNARGVLALAGEFHSATAAPVSRLASRLGLPFLCSSATTDSVIADNPDWVFRLAPPQSRGWRIYADYLIRAGHRHVALVIDEQPYWLEGANILRRHLLEQDVQVTSLSAASPSDNDVPDRLLRAGHRTPVDIVVLLVPYPDPLAQIVLSLRRRAPLADLALGDPAGRAAFSDWCRTLGEKGGGASYLVYLPPTTTPLGARVARQFQERYGRPPSFVAYEGYDAILTLATAIGRAAASRKALRDALGDTRVAGTRGDIEFSDDRRGGHQWQSPVGVRQRPLGGTPPWEVSTLIPVH